MTCKNEQEQENHTMTTDKKVALVTGANQGIGLEIARQLGAQGMAVVIGARDAAPGEAAAQELKASGLDAYSVKLDVTNADDIAALPAYFEQNFGRLDILINNAGLIVYTENTPDILRRTYEINVIGPYAITQALRPLLKAAPAGRIVNQSAGLGSFAVNTSGKLPPEQMLPAYNSSKAALNMLTVIQAAQVKDTRLKVNASYPGLVKTDSNPNGTLTVEVGAQTAVALATLPEDGPTGGFFHLGETVAW